MNDIALELARLHVLKGADFVRQLKAVTARPEFHPLANEPEIFTVGGEKGADYLSLLYAAQKAVGHGYTVYVLPNPEIVRSADFIFVRKGVYKLYDLKTITGKSSAENRLIESIGQTNRVLLNVTTDYNPGTLARSIKRYFENNNDALEVLIFKARKVLSVTRELTLSPNYYQLFMKRYMRGK